MKRLVGFAFFVFLPSMAAADCYCTCMNGQNVPLCSSTLDIPPICPPRVCAIEPPSIAPINPPTIPPIGTRNCWQEQVFNNFTGRYEWQQVCQ